MARRRKYAYIADPLAKAAIVVDRTIDTFATRGDELARNYRRGIFRYTTEEPKQIFAAVKLAGYYQGLSEPEVRNAIREAISKAKQRMTEVVSRAIEAGVVPVRITGRAERLHRQLSQILVGAAPAAPAPTA